MTTASTSPRHRAIERADLLPENTDFLANVLKGFYDKQNPLIRAAPKPRLAVLQLLKL